MADLALDTQELVALHKTGNPPANGNNNFITSTTAQEFLGVRNAGTGRLRYWIPSELRPKSMSSLTGKEWRIFIQQHANWRPWNASRRLDKIGLYFGQDYPAVEEIGHRAIAKMVNDGESWLLGACAEIAGTRFSRITRSRMEYLEENEILCRPLTYHSAEASLSIFHAFTNKYAIKSNYRNSLNDILILSVARHWSMSLLTRDQLLAKFSVEYLGTSVNSIQESTTIGFGKPISPGVKMRESKGYVNRHWNITGRRVNYHS
ncbi:hypothetical protein CLV63_10326 [Murinocardiopsis flavida]|uniref:PIN domain-containing protein n=1 Tax=Murinocardiopsis flavida TaxID=645275 RepID=A0A2P8DPZ9_9ACTN|nr:hypothetical protein CLV63_10326 [Murinocardiopsis flavida]